MNGGGDDEFSFRIQPKALILDVDRVVPSAGFALAWRINDGKKQAVSATMRGPASKIRADGKFFIDLSTMEPIRFTQRFRIEPGTVSRLEPHSLQIKVYRVTFKPNSLEEDTRERLYQRSVDLRTLLKRAGVTYSHSVELDDRLHHSLEIEYTVQLPDDEIELRAIETPQTADAAVVLPTPQFDDSRIPRSEVGNVWESISTRFDQARLDTRSELQVCSISQMVADSTRRDVDIPDMTLPLLFNLMFADKAPFPALVHNERQNAKVVEGHWSVDESETFASREDKYSARFGEHYNASEEVAFLFPVVVGAQQKKQFFKIAVIRALDAVMLDGVRLQVVTSIQESSTGCSVSFLAYPHFLSRALAFSGKGKATKLLDKLLNASTAALKKLTNAAQRSAQGDGGQAAGRPEMIHFDLWVRLADGNSADVVDYMLQRLCVPTTTPLPTDELKGRLYALDSILCRYRTHAAITARIMTYLDHLIDVHGASEIVRNSCIVDVVEHLERIATTAINRRVVLKLTQARDSGRDDMVRYIRHAQDPWECLSHPRIFVDARLVLEALARRPTVTRDRIPLLTCIMGMHATEVDVFDAVVTLCAENTALFVACADAAFHDALRTGLLFHPEVAFRRRDCVGILRANVATQPPTFASPFAAFIVEEVRFSCDAKLLDTDGKITVFVTSHFICFGDKDVFPLASLVPGNCRTFRSGFTPAVELHFVESSVSSAATMTTADVVAAAYVNTDATVRIATHKRPSLLSTLGIVIK